MNILFILLLAISLSMDAFSFALSIGTFNINTKNAIKLASIIGAFHFVMPLLGNLLGFAFKQIIHINFNTITGVIFLFIALEMIKDFKKEEIFSGFSLSEMFILALSVSLDSFAIGITLDNVLISNLIISIIFSCFSAFFTYIGLQIGKKMNIKLGSISKVIGVFIMITLAILSFVKY